ncbi:MAG: hypothetical protein IPM64_04610 [Phycisphaerales bacterium]|nr:hypothetical protein [Phycisphaerales bacterium]
MFLSKWRRAAALSVCASGAALSLASPLSRVVDVQPVLVERGVTTASLSESKSAETIASAGMWFEFIAPYDGILMSETCNSGIDTVVTVWDGTPGSGQQIASGDDECDAQSIVYSDMYEGATYLIHVASKDGRGGELALNLKPIPVTPFDAAPASTEGGIAAEAPDVVYTRINGVQTYAAVGGIRAYALGSDTCNIGLANLKWGGSHQGTPSLAMNAYRMHNGRLVQIGQGHCKQACCAAAGNGCGFSCNGTGGSMLGAGCLDVYGAGYNGGQSRLQARANLNAFTGAHTIANGVTGDSIFKRLQIAESAMSSTNFAGALYFVEGVYVASDDALASNGLNNASYHRVTVDGSFNMALQGTTQVGIPAIMAWRAHGLGLNQVDTRVVDSIVNVPAEGRFHVAHKVTDMGGGWYRYDYAIFNLNSDRSAGSLEIDIPAGATVQNVGFHDVNYHSGEPFDNTDWISTMGNKLRWQSPQTFAENPNSNALRWGTMYNFWFECNRPPVNGSATLGLFKPHTQQTVPMAVRVPGMIKGDVNCDGVLNNFDIDPFVLALVNRPAYLALYPSCPLEHGDINNDTRFDNFDIDPFVALITPAP